MPLNKPLHNAEFLAGNFPGPESIETIDRMFKKLIMQLAINVGEYMDLAVYDTTGTTHTVYARLNIPLEDADLELSFERNTTENIGYTEVEEDLHIHLQPIEIDEPEFRYTSSSTATSNTPRHERIFEVIEPEDVSLGLDDTGQEEIFVQDTNIYETALYRRMREAFESRKRNKDYDVTQERLEILKRVLATVITDSGIESAITY